METQVLEGTLTENGFSRILSNPLPRPLPAARHRRRRDGLDEEGVGRRHSGQPLRRQETHPMIVIMPNSRASAEPPPANPFQGNAFKAFVAFEDNLLKMVEVRG